MPVQDYLWGAEALTNLQSKKLDDHFDNYRKRYCTFARGAYQQLQIASDTPEHLQKEDLYVVLRDLMSYDGELVRAMRASAVPENAKRKWTSWFTWYVVHQCWEVEVASVTATNDE